MRSDAASRIALAASAALLLVGAAPAGTSDPYPRAIAAGYKAAMLCSGVFEAGRTPADIEATELHGIYPEYDAIVPLLSADIDRELKEVRVSFDPALPPRVAAWSREGGCTSYPIGASETSTTVDDPDARSGPLPADPHVWPQGDAGIVPHPSPALSAVVAAAFDHASYGNAAETIGVVVVKDGRIVAERYGRGWGPLVPNRTWSVAKSISGTLIGMAVRDHLADPKAPAPIPEWQDPLHIDPRAAITLDQLMRMGSGLHSDSAGNRTDAIYFGGSAVTDRATQWPLEVKPGTRFRYANNDILLAVRSLRTSMGETRYRNFPARALFGPIGMRNTVAETDWRGNYILSSQVWSTARDLARLGQFWLQDGVWQGQRLLPEGWMRYLTTPSGPQPASGAGYGATMWLFGPAQGLPAGSYAAQGNRGQYIMVIPSERLVVVRRGEDPGSARFDIARFAADIARAAR